ncbi:hypothetical protein AGMMS49587_14290 [Spirochaetia bacterium]|nr:hypothetical protein AGMMS49587_14290 [Spirochaetia bacterium]
MEMVEASSIAAQVYDGGKKVAQGIADALAKGVRLADSWNGYLKDQTSKLTENAASVSYRIADQEFPDLPAETPEKIKTRIKELIKDAKALNKPKSVGNVVLRINRIADQLNNDFYQILFVGRYSAGKSTLLNRLMKRNILPEDNLPTTQTLTWILHAKEPSLEKAAWNYGDDVKFDDLESLKREDKNNNGSPLNIYACVHANMFSEADDVLQGRVALIDTAGLKDPSGNKEPEKMANTLEAIKRADAVVLVLHPLYDLGTSYEDYLSILSEAGKLERLFVVINHMDEIKEDQRRSKKEEFINRVKGYGVNPTFFALSSKEGEEAIGDGIEIFRKKLTEFVKTDGVYKSRISTVDTHLGLISEEIASLKKKAEEEANNQNADAKAAKEKIIAEQTEIIKSNLAKSLSDIGAAKTTMLTNWGVERSNIEASFINMIDGAATSKELQNIKNTSQSKIRKDFQDFLQKQFNGVIAEQNEHLQAALGGITVYASEIPGLKSRFISMGWVNNLPQNTGTMVALALSINGLGFWGMLTSIPAVFLVFTFAPLFDTLFKGTQQIVSEALLRAEQKNIKEAFHNTTIPKMNEIAEHRITQFAQTLEEETRRIFDAILETIQA